MGSRRDPAWSAGLRGGLLLPIPVRGVRASSFGGDGCGDGCARGLLFGGGGGRGRRGAAGGLGGRRGDRRGTSDPSVEHRVAAASEHCRTGSGRPIHLGGNHAGNVGWLPQRHRLVNGNSWMTGPELRKVLILRVTRRSLGLLLAGVLAASLTAAPAAAQSAAAKSAAEGTDVAHETGTAQTVTFSGGGWGHGIGMSQYGAYGRALKGRSAGEILTKYYKGAGVKTVSTPKSIRVGLLQSRGQITVNSSAFRSGGGAVSFKVAGSKGTIADGGPGVEWRVEPSNTGGMRLYRNGNQVRKNGKTVFGDPDHALVMIFGKFGSLVSVSGKSHKYAYGKMDFGTHSSPCGSAYCLRLRLQLSMQKYLFGLSEVPASWPAAVLEAQAIAGRTYAFSKIKRVGQHLSPCDCAVYDSTVDQAYAGDGKRAASGQFWDDWKRAVNSTKGRVILHKGDPIQALYSSSSGGHTENNENVWGGAPIPYLRGVRDRADRVSANPNHTWSVSMRWRTFENKLQAAYGIGNLEAFRLVRPFGVSGRVTVVKPNNTGGVRIRGSRKTVRVSGWSVRSALGLKDTLFRVEIVRTAGTSSGAVTGA